MMTVSEVRPAGITIGEGGIPWSSPTVVVPLELRETVITCADGALRSTPMPIAPSPSPSVKLGVAKETVGGSSSSRIVTTWVAGAPMVAPGAESIVIEKVSLGSSTISASGVTEIVAVVCPAGIVAEVASAITSTPAVAVPPVEKDTIVSSSRAPERSSTALPLVAFSGRSCAAVRKLRVGSDSSSTKVTVWIVVAPS